MTKPKKILVVDDEPDIVTYLCSVLKDNGYQAISASNGKEGMDAAISEKPDVISLDISMPRETGVRMLRNLHDNDSTCQIPVILVTGVERQYEDFLKRHSHQVNPPVAYVEKPVESGEYIKTIEQALND